MKTLVITIDPAVNDEYPVNVYFDDGSANWQTASKAAGAIRKALTKPPHPTDAAGNPIAPDGIVRFLQDQERPDGARLAAIGEHLWSLIDRDAVGACLADVFAEHWKRNELDGKEGVRTILD